MKNVKSKNRNRIRNIVVIFLMVMLFLLSQGSYFIYAQNQEPNQVKNFILLIGDGMGNQQRRISAITRYDGDADKRLEMENLPTSGVAFNHSLDKIVTDSAASGTALSTGHKTNYGMLAMSPQGEQLKTILEACQENGKSTGLITTVMIYHATPAAFASHQSSRGSYSEIVEQYLTSGVDVFLGGGTAEFLPKSMGGKRKDDKDMISAFKKKGYTFIQNRSELIGLDCKKENKILGLFAKEDMAYEVDRNKEIEPSLAEMTDHAIKILNKNPQGFFLMVEGGKIDWACHNHDVAGSVYDTLAFDDAVKIAVDFAKKDGKTLIIVVNDHETGGMTISSKVNIPLIQNLKSSAVMMAKRIKDGEDIDKVFQEYTGIQNLEEDEKQIIKDEAEGKFKPQASWGYKITVVAHIISKRTGILFSTDDHSGTPVIVSALGPGCSIFDGFYDQSEIPVKASKLMNIKF